MRSSSVWSAAILLVAECAVLEADVQAEPASARSHVDLELRNCELELEAEGLALGGRVGAGGNIALGGSIGVGGSAGDAGASCASWTTEADCTQAGCMPILGTKTLTSSDRVFFDCQPSMICGAMVVAAYPPGNQAGCHVFPSTCIPQGWVVTSYSNCPVPTTGLLPQISGMQLYLDCMPSLDPVSLHGSFTVAYDNTTGSTSSEATIKSVALVYRDNLGYTFAVTPVASGPVEAGASRSVTHTKTSASGTGATLECYCSSSDPWTLNVTWEVEGQTISGSFGPTSMQCPL